MNPIRIGNSCISRRDGTHEGLTHCAFRYTMAFAGDSVMVSVDERTGLVSTRFLGRRAGGETMTR